MVETYRIVAFPHDTTLEVKIQWDIDTFWQRTSLMTPPCLLVLKNTWLSWCIGYAPIFFGLVRSKFSLTFST